MFSPVNDVEIACLDRGTVVCSMKTCRTQAARQRKRLPLFPCRPIGIIDYGTFARTIDPRIVAERISCPPLRTRVLVRVEVHAQE
jgi:hypothetical protein